MGLKIGSSSLKGTFSFVPYTDDEDPNTNCLTACARASSTEIHRAVDVGLDIKLRLSQRRTDAGARGQVNDAIELCVLECLTCCVVIAYVRLDQAIVGLRQVIFNVRTFDRGIVEIVEVVNDGYVPAAFRQQAIDKMRTDETGAAGD